MTARDPRYPPRRRRHLDGARPSGAHRGVAPRRLVGPAVIALLAVAGLGVAFGGGLVGGGSASHSPAAGDVALDASPSSPGSPPPASSSPAADTASAPPPADAASPPNVTPSPTPALVDADVAIVPVTSFRSARDSVRAADVRALEDGDGPFRALVLVESDADDVLAALGIERASLGDRLVTVASADRLATNLAKHRDRLGFLRADQVGPSVRALGWGSKALFGVDRVHTLAGWPLTARLPVPGDEPAAYDPASAWTLVAGGDILLDRGVALAIRDSRRGADFPFDGGSVDITGRCRDCSAFGWDLPYTKRTGNRGVVRDLLQGADLAIANFENPAPNGYRFHAGGTVFSANPAYIEGLANAGIDWVSLANNHIGDAGRNGIVQTMRNLDGHGIAHSGAGRNRAQAHEAALLKVGDLTVGLLGYDTIARYYRAGADTPGSARLTAKAVRRDVDATRRAGADVVIVFPHWGVEYRATPSVGQRDLGHAAIDAGADLVIGNHAHWAAAMEVYERRPIWYALGNFVFDQTWSEPTMEGILLELTFDGTELVQARMHPHLILDRAQPNALDPAGDGDVVLGQVFRASKGLLDW